MSAALQIELFDESPRETLILSPDQAKAYDEIVGFLNNPNQRFHVLKGYAGTGKSTLVGHLLRNLTKILDAGRLLNPSAPEWEIVLTATTNKAAEALSQIAGFPVRTIQSHLGLMVFKDYRTGQTSLRRKRNSTELTNQIIVIDEASYADYILHRFIRELTKDCKVLFIGDPTQLLAVGAVDAPVFNASYPTSELSAVMRQAKGNPIIELATMFREVVKGASFFSFAPDGQKIRHLPREAFGQELLKEFGRPDWRFNHSKVLAWTNKTVIDYNTHIRASVQGEPELQQGDYAICNTFVGNKDYSLKTDQLVCLTKIGRPCSEYGVAGRFVTLDEKAEFFLPNSRDDWKKCVNMAKASDNAWLLQHIDSYWVDLRAAYACTINKSQGSTYDRVFIDLDDLRKCNSANQLARMLYVAVSRARDQVTFTGDLV